MPPSPRDTRRTRSGPTGLAMLGALHRDDARARRCRPQPPSSPWRSGPRVRVGRSGRSAPRPRLRSRGGAGGDEARPVALDRAGRRARSATASTSRSATSTSPSSRSSASRSTRARCGRCWRAPRRCCAAPRAPASPRRPRHAARCSTARWSRRACARSCARSRRPAAHQHVAVRHAVGAPARRARSSGACATRSGSGWCSTARMLLAAAPPRLRRAAARPRHRLRPARRPALRAARGGGDLRDPRGLRRHRLRGRPPRQLRDRRPRYLGEGFDLIHYCGHVVSGPETGPALLLAEERPLTTAVIEANVAAGRWSS